jgi:hypothetical protein
MAGIVASPLTNARVSETCAIEQPEHRDRLAKVALKR